jgi:hypothetical protein
MRQDRRPAHERQHGLAGDLSEIPLFRVLTVE